MKESTIVSGVLKAGRKILKMLWVRQQE